MSESNEKAIELLVEIREALKNNNQKLAEMTNCLQQDRAMMWKIMGLTIVGAFAIIGVKIIFP